MELDQGQLSAFWDLVKVERNKDVLSFEDPIRLFEGPDVENHLTSRFEDSGNLLNCLFPPLKSRKMMENGNTKNSIRNVVPKTISYI